jgi:hypothetical protein
MKIIEINKMIDLAADTDRKVRKVPFGTFAGTLHRLVMLENGESSALDTAGMVKAKTNGFAQS